MGNSNSNIMANNCNLARKTPCAKQSPNNTCENTIINHNIYYKKYYYDENDVDNFDVDLYIQDRHYKQRSGNLDCYPRYC
jgi:hypothetical protein